MLIIVLSHKYYTFNICIGFNDITFYTHYVTQLCIRHKGYVKLLLHMDRSTLPHDTIPRTVGRTSFQTTGKSNAFGRKPIIRAYLCILQLKTNNTIIVTMITGLLKSNELLEIWTNSTYNLTIHFNVIHYVRK